MTALIYKTVAEMIDQAGLSPHAVLTDILITRHDEPLTRAVSCTMNTTTRQKRPLQTTRRTTSPTWLEPALGLKTPPEAREGPPDASCEEESERYPSTYASG